MAGSGENGAWPIGAGDRPLLAPVPANPPHGFGSDSPGPPAGGSIRTSGLVPNATGCALSLSLRIGTNGFRRSGRATGSLEPYAFLTWALILSTSNAPLAPSGPDAAICPAGAAPPAGGGTT